MEIDFNKDTEEQLIEHFEQQFKNDRIKSIIIFSLIVALIMLGLYLMFAFTAEIAQVPYDYFDVQR